MSRDISEDDGALVPQWGEKSKRSFPSGDCALYNASSLNDFHLCELFLLFSPMWGVRLVLEPGQWAVHHIFCFIFLSLLLYTCPAITHQPLLTNQKPAQSSVTNEKLWHSPRLGSGDKGQICHLSSQISVSSLQMILGMYHLRKIDRKQLKFLAFISRYYKC